MCIRDRVCAEEQYWKGVKQNSNASRVQRAPQLSAEDGRVYGVRAPSAVRCRAKRSSRQNAGQLSPYSLRIRFHFIQFFFFFFSCK